MDTFLGRSIAAWIRLDAALTARNMTAREFVQYVERLERTLRVTERKKA